MQEMSCALKDEVIKQIETGLFGTIYLDESGWGKWPVIRCQGRMKY